MSASAAQIALYMDENSSPHTYDIPLDRPTHKALLIGRGEPADIKIAMPHISASQCSIFAPVADAWFTAVLHGTCSLITATASARISRWSLAKAPICRC